MALMKMPTYVGGGGGTDYEVVDATIPASSSNITIPLTKGKMPYLIFINRGWFYSNFDSSGNISDSHIYYPTGGYQQSNITLSTTQIVWSGFDTSSIASTLKVYVVYK